MRQRVFERENRVLQDAAATGATDAVTADAFRKLADEYEKLLRQAEKIVTIGDLTQNKLIRAQKMLHRAIQRYKSTAEQKSELLSMVSHDIKNKAAPIRELAAWALEDLGNGQTGHAAELLAQVRKASEQLLLSVNDSLNRESASATTIVPVFEWTDVSRLAASAVEAQRPGATKKNIVVETDIEPDCEARIDEFLLGEVFENLVSNAVKFSPAGSRIFVTLKNGENSMTFSVRDPGPGLTDEDRRKMFGKYQTLSAKPTGGEVSTGIGLYITQKLVAMHNGTIEAFSDGPGTGSTFVVAIPTAERPRSVTDMSDIQDTGDRYL